MYFPYENVFFYILQISCYLIGPKIINKIIIYWRLDSAGLTLKWFVSTIHEAMHRFRVVHVSQKMNVNTQDILMEKWQVMVNSTRLVSDSSTLKQITPTRTAIERRCNKNNTKRVCLKRSENKKVETQ